jgi:hypothetical protein
MKNQTFLRWAMPIVGLFIGFSNLSAQDGKISGYIFGDYFNVNIIPNVKIENYQAAGRDANTTGLLTFFFRF